MRDNQRRSSLPSRHAIALLYELKEFGYGSAGRRLGVSGSREDPGVIVRTCRKDFAPRLRMGGSEALAIRESQNDLRRQRSQNEPRRIAQERITQPVDALEMLEQEDELLNMIRSQVAIFIVERVRDGMADTAP